MTQGKTDNGGDGEVAGRFGDGDEGLLGGREKSRRGEQVIEGLPGESELGEAGERHPFLIELTKPGDDRFRVGVRIGQDDRLHAGGDADETVRRGG